MIKHNNAFYVKAKDEPDILVKIIPKSATAASWIDAQVKTGAYVYWLGGGAKRYCLFALPASLQDVFDDAVPIIQKYIKGTNFSRRDIIFWMMRQKSGAAFLKLLKEMRS